MLSSNIDNNATSRNNVAIISPSDVGNGGDPSMGPNAIGWASHSCREWVTEAFMFMSTRKNYVL